jgi:hypothetical protein
VVGERTAEEVANGSATWRNYLAPAESNALYGNALSRFMQPERRLFPGFVATALALVGLWRLGSPHDRAARSPDPQVLAYALGLLLAFDVSLGFNGFTYRVLYDYVLPFRGLRIPARMGMMVGFSLAILAGYGADRLAGGRRSVMVALALLMLAEYASRPLDLRQIATRPPEVYADITRDRGDSPVPAIFEFPATPQDDPTWMYYSTFHWMHLVNGYSGFFPPSYGRLLRGLRDFPDQESIDAIKSHGARYVVVHGERLNGARYETLVPDLDKRPDFSLVSRHPWQHSEISLYRVSYADAP